MADILEDAVNWLAGQRKEQLGQSVRYARGTAAVDLIATVANPGAEVDEATVIRHRSEELEFIVTWSDLVIGGERIKPAEGDRIAFGADEYEVVPGDSGEVYRKCDPYGATIRIHAQRVN